jgi:hypothetical protein
VDKLLWENAMCIMRLNGVIMGRSVNPLLALPGGGGTIGDAQNLERALDAYRLPIVALGLPRLSAAASTRP